MILGGSSSSARRSGRVQPRHNALYSTRRIIMKHTISYTSGSSDTPLLGITIGDMFDQTAARYPDSEALIVRHQNIRYTYRQLKAHVDRCARALMALGVAQ